MAKPGTYVIRDFRSGSGYLVPNLVGLTVEQAAHEWTHRYGVRVVTDQYPYNADYRGQQHEVTWQGFTGEVTTDPEFTSPDDLVGGFTTDPPGGVEGGQLAASAAVQLEIALPPGNYNLVTGSGDPLVTAGGDPLYVEIS